MRSLGRTGLLRRLFGILRSRALSRAQLQIRSASLRACVPIVPAHRQLGIPARSSAGDWSWTRGLAARS
jgi:hypothetical protein